METVEIPIVPKNLFYGTGLHIEIEANKIIDKIKKLFQKIAWVKRHIFSFSKTKLHTYIFSFHDDRRRTHCAILMLVLGTEQRK